MQRQKTCPHCGVIGDLIKWGSGKNRQVRYRCKSCHKTCNQRTGTIRYRSHVKDHEWQQAVKIFCLRSGLSGSDLGRFLDRHPRTGQRMWRKIRRILPESTGGPPLAGPVELDETIMHNIWIGGGKSRKDKKLKLLPLSSRDQKTMHQFVHQLVATQAAIITDEWGGYRGLGKNHYTVCHSKEFVFSGMPEVHTNGIEGVWGYAKPKAYHIYRGYPYLPEYLKEICFYFNFSYYERKAYLFSLLARTNSICS